MQTVPMYVQKEREREREREREEREEEGTREGERKERGREKRGREKERRRERKERGREKRGREREEREGEGTREGERKERGREKREREREKREGEGEERDRFTVCNLISFSSFSFSLQLSTMTQYRRIISFSEHASFEARGTEIQYDEVHSKNVPHTPQYVRTCVSVPQVSKSNDVYN